MQRLRACLLGLLCFAALAPGAETAVPAADRSALTAGGNAFAVDLYGALRTQPGNLFFSPQSLSSVLAMAYAGARGETATAMAHTLHFTLPGDQLHPAMGALLTDWNGPHASYQLSVANALWAQHGKPVLPAFHKLMTQDYEAAFQEVDFKTAPETARLTINRWVEERTADKIKDLLPPGALKPTTHLVLTNAIYFQGDWQTPFEKTLTQQEAFHPSPAATLQTPLMHCRASFRYYDGGTFQELELPYKGNELSMVVLLPKEVDGLAVFERSLTAANLEQWLQKLMPARKVDVTLPRFKMTRELELGDTLGAMGMRQAFGNGADFSGMTGHRDLAISAVIHKAFVDVNEQGTEAAAATAVTMRAMAMPARNPEPPPVFRADHPFLFLIRDLRTNSVLFIGRLQSPLP